MSFAELALKQGLTLSEIDLKLSEYDLKQRHGGRRPRMLGSVKSAEVGLYKLCVSWNRLFQFLSEEPGHRPSSGGVQLSVLPMDVQVAVHVVENAVVVLRESLENHLPKVKQSRETATLRR